MRALLTLLAGGLLGAAAVKVLRPRPASLASSAGPAGPGPVDPGPARVAVDVAAFTD